MNSAEYKRKKKNLTFQRNRLRAAQITGKCKTLKGFYRTLGYSEGDIEYVFNGESERGWSYKNDQVPWFEARERDIDEEYARATRPAATQPEAYTGDYPGITLVTRSVAAPPEKKEEPAPVIEVGAEMDLYQAKCPGQTATLLPEQARCAKILFNNIVNKDVAGQILYGVAGDGKTFVYGSLITNLERIKFFEGKSLSPWPKIVFTKAQAVIQTEEVLRDYFGLNTVSQITVTNIDQLRAKFGELFITEEIEHINGKPVYSYKWKQWFHAVFMLVDECHILNRPAATQTKIMLKWTDIRDNYNVPTYTVSASATPYSRVADAQFVACTTGHLFNSAIGPMRLNNNTWKAFTPLVCWGSNPLDYNAAATARLTKELEPYIIRMRKIRSKFKAINSVTYIDFENKEEEREYSLAYERFLAEKALAEGNDNITDGQRNMLILVSFLKFRQAAELIKAWYYAKRVHKLSQEGYAPVVGLNFKDSISKVYSHLVNDFAWSRDDVSLIWGGAASKTSKKKDAARALKGNPIAIDALKSAGLTLADLGLDFTEEELEEKSEEQIEFERTHKLGNQSRKESNRQKKLFQRQKSKACIYTLKKGGTSLSLHHEFEDTLPRWGLFGLTYSEKEVVQFLGRAHRITSLSDTNQEIIGYNNTIEMHVLAKVSKKLTGLAAFTRRHESWVDIVVGYTIDTFDDDEDEDEEGGGEVYNPEMEEGE